MFRPGTFITMKIIWSRSNKRYYLPHGRFGNGAVEQGAEAAIKTSKAMILHRQPHTVSCEHSNTRALSELSTMHSNVFAPRKESIARTACFHACENQSSKTSSPMPRYRGLVARSSS